ncbi:MAG TPA: Gfo/Idh/MocA family oxidoreductase [bacterium]|nr:Gfo/Idh/MocA family oxidoreductase [bacterium]HOL94185.1 Gfo/Idh/MocA family oxidoreductase [bacterium]HPP02127.1 Gfo/Idh/MocA family oxidoreductase [bacterium]
MTPIPRRSFLQRSLTAGAVFAISGTQAGRTVLGANDLIRVAVSGIHGRGGDHINEFMRIDGVQVVCLVDPDARTFENRIKQVEKLGGKTPKTYQDIRRALEDKDIDVLSIASTNHWHSLSTIWGCQAGKDVYVEKPCSHNVREGRVCVQAARYYNRIVQHGTQGRSSRGWWQLAEHAKKGTFGQLVISRGLVYKRRDSIGFKPNTDPPAELDYDLWLGPAPDQFYNANLVHYNWHWFWDFGNGDIGNQGVHQMDIARWMIPGATLPKSVICVGGRFGYIDQGQTANTQVVLMDYGTTQLIFEVRGLPTDTYMGADGSDDVMHFEAGTVVNGKFIPKEGGQPHDLPEVDVQLGPGGGHFQNFIAAVRSRKSSDLNADILEGHYSAALCHLANISYRLGQPVPFSSSIQPFGDNAGAQEAFERMKQHLVMNGVKLEDTAYFLGRKLEIDPATETITNDIQANDMLTRYYRPPFVVPETIG